MPLSSSTYVFELSELASLITSFLLQNDISHLMQTSRRMHATMEPWFYYNLTTVYKVVRLNLSQSPEALNALTRNIHHTRSWTTDLFNLMFFIYAGAVTPVLKGHELEGEEEEALDQGSDMSLSAAQPSSMATAVTVSTSTTTTMTTAMAKETSLVALTPRMNLCLTAPLPPMTHLTKLDIDPTFRASYYGSLINSGLKSPYLAIVHLCTTLRRSPHLRELCLRHIIFQDLRSATAFATTLCGLTRLTHLHFYFNTFGASKEAGLLAFFSCPPLVRCLTIERVDTLDRYNATGMTADSIQDIELFVDKVRARATTQLVYLQEFRFCDSSMDSSMTTAEELYAILARCPNIETLCLQWRFVADNLDGSKIGRMCPKMRNFSYYCNTVVEDFKEWPYMLGLTLPEHQLEGLIKTDVGASIDGDLVGRALVRHCRSLRKLILVNCIPSKTVGMILEHCEALEILDVRRSMLDLEDAIAAPWASSRMMELSLDINTGVKRKVFYLRPSPSRRSPKEKQLFGRLESLYRQIGKQTNLRTLCLGQRNERDCKKMEAGKYIQPFAGMLRLSDKKDGVVSGYLELLVGLKQLWRISGSVGPETKNYKVAVDSAEAKWMIEHWPAFVCADFFPRFFLPRDRVGRFEGRHRNGGFGSL
ncbi:hypothetical protein BGZ96_002569 [Linnemannia gamsii]|uniref:F-box domain-containing protein n=1 Tax=Linnemannia gamsii TaxID=64522 RepID=A0ABQ7K8J2_9FUNG|nr:hypothetical protein BGZ96_002569 [Linnemannia gamsii]